LISIALKQVTDAIFLSSRDAQHSFYLSLQSMMDANEKLSQLDADSNQRH